LAPRVESEFFQDGGEQGRMLEAIAAAASADELALNAVEIEPDAAAERNIEILEWNLQDMRAQ
jgi:hypothetical protein